MTNRSHKRTLLLFGALSIYIVLQFTWWAVLLLRKDREALQLALEVQALGGPIVDQPDPAPVRRPRPKPKTNRLPRARLTRNHER